MNSSIRIIVIIICLNCLAAITVAAQGGIIRGTIMDSETNERIIGATITEYDTDGRIISGTISDPNGNYVLTVKNSDGIFRVSFIGYKTFEFRLEGRESIDISLNSESIQLDEIMIVAETNFDPLTNVSQRDMTSSRVRIDMAESKHIGSISAEEALQGQVSGLDIMSVSGNPGTGSQIVIRGLGSLGNSRPLIVVDGIPQDISIDQGFDFGSADQEDIGDMVNISPQDIKSIDVLKDAASAAVWGSKGADGVLLIETYRGKKGKTMFEYQGKYTWNIQPAPVPMLNGDEYIMMQREQLHNQLGLYTIPREIAYDRDFIDFYNYSGNTDWVGEITQTGFINDQYFKVSGGGDKTKYFASVNYQDNTGTTINTSLQRLSTRINLDYNVSKKLRFSTNFNYTNSVKEDNYVFKLERNLLGEAFSTSEEDNTGKVGVNIREMAYIKAPNMSIWEYDWQGNPTGEYFTPQQSYQGDGTVYFNPVAVGNLSVNDNNQNIVQNSFILNYNMLTWLRFQQTFTFQYQNNKIKTFLPIDAVGAEWLDPLNNEAYESNRSDNRIMSRSQVFFVPRFEKNHTFSGILMFETEQQRGERANLKTSNSSSTSIVDPAANPPIRSINSTMNESKSIGILGSLNYKLKDRYILSVNTRVDGSSKFGANRRWGVFPSLSAGWRFSEESLFSGITFFNDGKLRASWGQTGKQPGGAYDRHAIFNTPSTNQYIFKPIIVPVQVQLENLKWQRVTSWNVGLDLSFFNNRFSMTAEIYNKITDDILWKNYKLPQASGFTKLKWYNGGKLQNQGWEFFFNVVPLRRNDMSLSLNFNISQNINSFLEFPPNFNNEVETSVGNGKFPRRADIGKPIGSFYGFRYLGVWPSDEDVVALDANGDVLVDPYGNKVPLTFQESYEFQGGDAIYQDINHDGKIDIMDAVYLGDSSPDFLGGFGGTLTWKSFLVSAQFHYRTGFDIVNEVALRAEGMLDRNNQSKAVLHRWRVQEQDESDMIPRAYMGHEANNLGSDRYVEAGDFLRLNNLSLRYRLPKPLAKRIRLNAVDIALNMRKILTVTGYSGQDPEIPAIGDDPFWFGTDKARTPTPKAYTLSIAIEF